MKLGKPTILKTEVLVLGGGGAGLRAAIEARRGGAEVWLVCRARAGYGNNTAIAAGAIAASFPQRDPRDSPDQHLKDSVVAGRFLNNQRLLETLTQSAEPEISNLEKLGVQFRKRDGAFVIAPASGHSYPRTVSCVEGMGVGLTLPLRRQAETLGVKVVEGLLATALLKRGQRVAGVLAFDPQGQTLLIHTKAVILALGGLGQVYLRTNNAAEATGDGYALAYRAGLPLVDMEFVQFFPTGLGRYGSKFILYDAFTTGQGATIKNARGEDVLEKYGLKDPMRQTRDSLSRAVMLEILAGRDVDGALIFDISSVSPELKERARARLHLLKGLPPGQTQFAVAPTAHFQMGGVKIDARGGTDLEGLYAAGEVCGGAHGTNRLPGNALLECFVIGALTGQAAAAQAKKVDWLAPDEAKVSAELRRLETLTEAQGMESLQTVRDSLRRLMLYQAGVIRHQKSLSQALVELEGLGEKAKGIPVTSPQELTTAVRLSNMLLVAEMICRTALERTESRGTHYRTDYPQENNAAWLQNIILSQREGRMSLTPQPVEMLKVSPAGAA